MQFLSSPGGCCRPYRPRDLPPGRPWLLCPEPCWSLKKTCIPVPIHRSIHSSECLRSATFTACRCRKVRSRHCKADPPNPCCIRHHVGEWNTVCARRCGKGCESCL